MKDKITREINETINEKFIAALEGVEWATIDQIVEKLSLIPNFWESIATLEEIKEQWRKEFARRKIRTLKVDGMPLFASLEEMDDNGDVQRVYKNEAVFTAEDYHSASLFHSRTGIHHLKMSKHYAEGYKRMTDEQIDLPFDVEKLID